MSNSHGARKRMQLRHFATNLLKDGTTPLSYGVIGKSALSVLHRLANAPANADDALAMLHELQVHQVELDLQHEEIEAHSQELAADLQRYKELYEFAPIGLFIISQSGTTIEANTAGTDLFNLQAGAMDGLPFHSFLSVKSRPALLALRLRLLNGSVREICESETGAENAARTVRIIATPLPSSGSFILTLIEVDDYRKLDASL